MTTTTKNANKSKRKRKRKKITLTTTIPQDKWRAIMDGGHHFNDKLMMTNISSRDFGHLNQRPPTNNNGPYQSYNNNDDDDDDEYDEYEYDDDYIGNDCVQHTFAMFIMTTVIFNSIISIPRYFLS